MSRLEMIFFGFKKEENGRNLFRPKSTLKGSNLTFQKSQSGVQKFREISPTVQTFIAAI